MPIKVHILLGQSNMLGFGRIGPKEVKGSLEFMVKEKGRHPHLVDDAGNWATRPDVRYVQVMDQRGVDYKDMDNIVILSLRSLSNAFASHRPAHAADADSPRQG